MNILYLAHRIPYPPNKGDKIRSYNEIKYLSRNHNVYLVTILEQPSDTDYIEALKKYCAEIHAVHFDTTIKLLRNMFQARPFSIAHFYDKGLQEYIDTVLKERKIDSVICFCSSMAEYIFNTPGYKEGKMDGIKLIMDYIDMDSDKWAQYAAYTRFPLSLLYRIENKRLFQYEIKVNKAFHNSVFVSNREVEVFTRLYPQAKNISVISNGVDTEFFKPKGIAPSNRRPLLVFTGVMDYFANEDGVTWFCENIFPYIREEIPDVQFYIVGNKPTTAVWRLTEIDGVTVTGYVDDINEFYRLADICVIPLRIARGLQNKVLEAMATGNAVVATSNASDGIVCRNNWDIIIADKEKDFAREVVGLLRDKARVEEIGENAVENIKKNYMWESNLEIFEELLQDSK